MINCIAFKVSAESFLSLPETSPRKRQKLTRWLHRYCPTAYRFVRVPSRLGKKVNHSLTAAFLSRQQINFNFFQALHLLLSPPILMPFPCLQRVTRQWRGPRFRLCFVLCLARSIFSSGITLTRRTYRTRFLTQNVDSDYAYTFRWSS